MSRLVWTLGFVAVTSSSALVAPNAAEACGFKVTIQPTKFRKPISASANPSRILVLGEPQGGVDKALSRAGHEVDTAESADAVRGKQYSVIVVDDEGAAARARQNWPDAQVLTMHSGARTMVDDVEATLSRRPMDTATKREVIAAREDRAPVAAGPTDSASPSARSGSIVASGRGEETRPVASAPVDEEPTPPPVAAAEPAPASRDATMIASRAPKAQAPEAVPSGAREVFFSVGASQLTGESKKALQAHAKWLAATSGGKLVLEGHADATGNSATNLEISRKRAESAKAYLLSQGANASRIEVVALGQEQLPFDPPTNAKNRCVVVTRSE